MLCTLLSASLPPHNTCHTRMADLLSKQSLTALSFVATLAAGAYISARSFLPKKTTSKARVIFTWLAFDSLTHFLLEGSFLYYSINGRSINKTTSFLAYLWQDYARADARWGTADPTVVSLEIRESAWMLLGEKERDTE